LRGQIDTTVRQSSARHLEGRIMAQIVEIIAVGVAARDGENAFTQDIRYRMRDLGRITSVGDQPGQRVDQAKTLVGGGQNENATI
jgi:hypothetical protein